MTLERAKEFYKVHESKNDINNIHNHQNSNHNNLKTLRQILL